MEKFKKLNELKAGDKYRYVHDTPDTIRILESETKNKLIIIPLN